MGIAPWLMWGSAQSQTFSIDAGNTGLGNAGGQIARVDYARPETWSFFLAANVTDFQYFGGGVPRLTIFYDLTIGLGRSTIAIPAFETYFWDLPAEVGVLRYSTEVTAPPRNNADTTQNLIREIATQTLNLGYRAQMFVPAGQPATASIEVHGYFAPKNHIRPEWFKDGKFTGGEDTGL